MKFASSLRALFPLKAQDREKVLKIRLSKLFSGEEREIGVYTRCAHNRRKLRPAENMFEI